MKRIVGFLLIFMAVLSMSLSLSTTTANAANAADFNPGKIIDDAVFYNSNSMTTTQIQNFLNSKNPNCDWNGTQPASDWGYPGLTHAQLAARISTSGIPGYNNGNPDPGFHAPPYRCLTMYTQTTPVMESASGYCDSISAGTRSAAQIINDVAKACGINPQDIIVLLQKETSLVTDNWPLNRQLDQATGFACPDSAACNPAFAGFFSQVYSAAKQFKIYQSSPTDYNYQAGRTNTVLWNPNTSCGSSGVYIQNQATAALYIYTPYRPNQAALDNLYGSGDSCSSYGNRNFWRIFTDWFGSTQVSRSLVSDYLPDGDYYIASSLNPSATVEPTSGDGLLRVAPKTDPNTAFHFTRNSDGYYTITNVATGKVIDIPGANALSGVQLQQWDANGSDAQEWLVQNDGTGSLTISSKLNIYLVMDLSGGSTTTGTNVTIYNNNNSAAQSFYLAPVNQSLADNNYYIASQVDSSKSLDVSGGSLASGAGVDIYQKNYTMAQRWHTTYDPSTGYYSILSVGSNKPLDIYGGSTTDGAKLQIWDNNGSCAQKWRINKLNNISYEFISACSGKVVDVTGASSANSTPVQLWTRNGSNAQSWTFSIAQGQLIQNGTYKITSKLSPTKVIDVSGGDIANGAKTQLWDDNGSGAQRWNVQYDDNGEIYTITNASSNRPLDIPGASTSNGTGVQVWGSNGTCAQRWRTINNADGTLGLTSLCSNKALDVSGGNSSNGAKVQIWDNNGSDAQKWIFTPTAGIVADGLYNLQTSASTVLDIPGGSTASGVKLQIFTSNGSGAQIWQIIPRTDGLYAIRNPQSGKYLDISGVNTTAGARVQIYDGNNSCSQQWAISANNDGSYGIISSCSGKRLDVFGGATSTSGTVVDIWDSNATDAQNWKLSPVS